MFLFNDKITLKVKQDDNFVVVKSLLLLVVFTIFELCEPILHERAWT